MSKVTIVMPVFNAMPYLPEAVESIRGQSMQDWTFLIVDDGSTDGSRTYLDSIDDHRVKVYCQENQGPAPAFNRALVMCETELLARMDADDVSRPTRLQEQVAYLENHPDVGLIGSQFVPLGSSRVGRGSKLPITHNRIFEELLCGRHAICNPTVMCRSHLLREIGGYQPEGVLEDWAMFLSMGEIAKLANLDRVLLSYRIHSGSTNNRHMAELRSRIAFVSDRVNRTRAGLELLDYGEFQLLRRRSPVWQRAIETCNVQAMVLYRQSQAEILGDRPVTGFLRLVMAAALSPSTTYYRVTRGIRNRWSGTKELHFEIDSRGSAQNSDGRDIETP